MQIRIETARSNLAPTVLACFKMTGFLFVAEQQ